MRNNYKQRGVVVKVGGKTGLAMRNARFDQLLEVPWEGATTIANLFEQACLKHENRRFLGTRKLIQAEAIEAEDGSGHHVDSGVAIFCRYKSRVVYCFTGMQS
ncbi:Long chain acyl-CoA synthetase 8 [Bienertia sinuspersici]